MTYIIDIDSADPAGPGCSDLSAWSTATTFVSSTNNRDDTSTEVYRSNTPISAEFREFICLKVSAR